ncbi:MAG: hypothetical protein II969_08935 [Anaerolineaceae bacterium]|nr:hypothetical protein [Anaerolineaceae bacterium]
MKCELMHRQISAAEIEIDSDSGFITKIYSVSAPEHLPLAVTDKGGKLDRSALNRWWLERSIPATRSGLRDALNLMDIDDSKQLLARCYGLSLSDQYWVKPESSGLSWKTINFFENPFSEDIGDALFGKKKHDVFSYNSPDSTSDGNLKKRWKIINGKRFLLKGGTDPFRQQPFNEVVASEIMDRLEIPHVPYTVTQIDGQPYSLCEDFIAPETELVPAARIIQVKKKRNEVSAWQHFVDCCEMLGIPNVVSFLDQMVMLDFIIANEDRHYNNFGAVRNAITLEWIGMAPIFDCGSSLGYNKVERRIAAGTDIICKPFKQSHEEQLELVTDFNRLNFDRLSDVREMISGILSTELAAETIDEKRIKTIVDAVEKRIEIVKMRQR